MRQSLFYFLYQFICQILICILPPYPFRMKRDIAKPPIQLVCMIRELPFIHMRSQTFCYLTCSVCTIRIQYKHLFGILLCILYGTSDMTFLIECYYKS